MMHISIPSLKEIKDSTGNYTVYHVHINGIQHCTVRYSQLHALHEQLKQTYGSQCLPPFPPKKLFLLSQTQLEERRCLLENYLQRIGQHSEIANNIAFRRFLLSSQRNTSTKWYNQCTLNIWLQNGTKMSIEINASDSSEDVLQRVCENVRIPHELSQYFSLYIQKISENDISSLIHILDDIENPILTLNTLAGRNRIILRKSCWDPAFDMKLMTDKATLNVLYAQTISDIEDGVIVVDSKIKNQLFSLQSRGEKREYMDIARTLKYYGYLRFDSCTCDYPEPGTEVIVYIGHKEICFVSKPNVQDISVDYSFKIVRIRCWKITHSTELIDRVQLSFEYLIAKDKLQWITVLSEYSYILSVCLQSIVDELMLKRNGSLMSKNSPSKRDSTKANGVEKVTDENTTSENGLYTNAGKNLAMTDKVREKLARITVGNQTSKSFQNKSFENIGDDDL